MAPTNLKRCRGVRLNPDTKEASTIVRPTRRHDTEDECLAHLEGKKTSYRFRLERKQEGIFRESLIKKGRQSEIGCPTQGKRGKG